MDKPVDPPQGMPKIVKWIYGILFLLIGFDVFMTAVNWSVGIGFILKLAVLTGLATRDPLAWHFARLMFLLVFGCSILMLVLALFSEPATKLNFLVYGTFSGAVSGVIYFGLGKPEARNYFGHH